MSEEILLPFALTSLDRVKDKLGIDISKTSNDAVLKRIINSVTGYIEKQCDRRFLETTYSNEVYCVKNKGLDILCLKNAPVTTLTSFQYRQGEISSPTWTNYNANDYELIGDGSSGMIKVYSYLVTGINTVRASYTAGYKISFKDMGDETKHNLPPDISELCEKLVIKFFQRKQHPGKSSESFNGNSITWSKELDPEDLQTLAQYRRYITPIF